MGWFGNETSNTSNTTNNYDQRTIEENQNEGSLSGNKGTINYSNTGGEAFDLVEKVVSTASQNNAALLSSLGQTQSEAFTGGQSGIVDSIGSTVKWIAIAAAVAYALKGRAF